MDKEQRYKNQIIGFAESINEFAQAVGDDTLNVEIDENGAVSVSDLRQVGTRVVDMIFESTAVIEMDAAMEHLDNVAYMNGWIDGSNFERGVEPYSPDSNEDQTQPDDSGPNNEE